MVHCWLLCAHSEVCTHVACHVPARSVDASLASLAELSDSMSLHAAFVGSKQRFIVLVHNALSTQIRQVEVQPLPEQGDDARQVRRPRSRLDASRDPSC